jgi:hypothetical protein
MLLVEDLQEDVLLYEAALRLLLAFQIFPPEVFEVLLHRMLEEPQVEVFLVV